MTMIKYECEPCGYIYDPAVGDPDAGIDPETAFEDIPSCFISSVIKLFIDRYNGMAVRSHYGCISSFFPCIIR